MANVIFPSNRKPLLEAPAHGRAYTDSYSPVDCDFTDDLEFASVAGVRLEISYRTAAEKVTKVEGMIRDIVTEATKEEYAVLDSGLRIRLDHLVRLRILPT